MKAVPENIQEGANILLAETINILTENNVNYIVVGGWSPYLLNSTEIKHPGTKDVDILFENGYEKDNLKDIILKFIDSGFILSAKHDFQLFKKIKVRNYDFIYNIDLLHPSETEWDTEIFIDHLELDVPSDEYRNENFKMKSIALPDSNFLFEGHFVDFSIDFKLSNGDKVRQEVRLMDELGCLLTKSKSVKIVKRFRDSLDIYLAIKQSQDYNKLVDSTLELKLKNRTIYNSLYGIREAFEKRVLFKNTKKYIDIEEKDFNNTISDFINSVGLNEKAENT